MQLTEKEQYFHIHSFLQKMGDAKGLEGHLTAE